MGIFQVLAGVIFGFASVLVFMTSYGRVPNILIAGECAIVGAVLFGAGAICNEIDKLRTALTVKRAE